MHRAKRRRLSRPPRDQCGVIDRSPQSTLAYIKRNLIMNMRTIPLFNRVLVVMSSSVCALAFAQSPTSPPPSPSPAAAATLTRPAHNCVKPGQQPGRLASANQIKNYNAEVKAYQDCLQTFVKVQSELVKLHSEVGNAAVNEFNDFVTEMKLKKEEAAK